MTYEYSALNEVNYNFDSEEHMYESFQTETNDDLLQQYTGKTGWFRILNFAYPWLHLRPNIKSELTIDSFPKPQIT
jgi:hypothetical protein